MSVTRPESEFYLIPSSKGEAGIIIWNDGHSVGAGSINEAIEAGMKFFIEVYEDGDYAIVCSKSTISSEEAESYLEMWDDDQDKKGSAVSAMEKYRAWYIDWPKVPDELSTSSGTTLEDLMPYCTEIGERTVDLEAGPIEILKQLNCKYTYADQMSVEEIVENVEYCISLSKEPCIILKRIP